jgi:hypothetical protein
MRPVRLRCRCGAGADVDDFPPEQAPSVAAATSNQAGRTRELYVIPFDVSGEVSDQASDREQ